VAPNGDEVGVIKKETYFITTPTPPSSTGHPSDHQPQNFSNFAVIGRGTLNSGIRAQIPRSPPTPQCCRESSPRGSVGSSFCECKNLRRRHQINCHSELLPRHPGEGRDPRSVPENRHPGEGRDLVVSTVTMGYRLSSPTKFFKFCGARYRGMTIK